MAYSPFMGDGYMRSDEEIKKSISDGILEIVNIVMSRNKGEIIIPLTWFDGGYIDYSSGEQYPEEGSSYSDYTLIETDRLIFTNTMTSDNEYNVFYDENKKFLSSFSNATGVVEVPNGAKYFRLSKYSSATLTVKMDYGYATKSYVDKAISDLEERLKPSGSVNLFDIDGQVDVNYSGTVQNLNSVSNGILTCMANSSANHAVGQIIDTEVGATYIFSGIALSFGTSSSAVACFYKAGTYEDEIDETIRELGYFEFEHVARTDRTLFGFATSSGTGSQFTNIKVVKK